MLRTLKVFLLAILLGATALTAAAQRQLVRVDGIPPVREGAHAGADYDGDGDGDVFITGRQADGTLQAVLYKFLRRRVVQLGIGRPTVYADYQEVPFAKTSVIKGSVTWHDLNRDGRPDLVVTGLSLTGYTSQNVEILVPSTVVYLNRGSDSFQIVASTGLPAVYNSKVAAGDFNGDGFQDLILGGQAANGLHLGVWLANNAQRFTPGPTTFTGLQVNSISVADIDRDGDLDFIVSGTDSQNTAVLSLYTNDGTARFTEVPTTLPKLYFGGTAFGDVDFDGDVDLLINGGHIGPSIMRGETSLYLNDGRGGFTKKNIQVPGLYAGGVSLLDLDGDTDSDILTWGIENLNQIGSEKVVAAENIDLFLLRIGSPSSVLNGHVSWFDYDGNGRKDAFLSGDLAGDRAIFIYEF
ncbi:MAG: VCBS repeat-containing protein [Bacteroidetes bacterium]|nr:VCBS repeat-containing protein [Bacteroidota bacterium]